MLCMLQIIKMQRKEGRWSRDENKLHAAEEAKLKIKKREQNKRTKKKPKKAKRERNSDPSQKQKTKRLCSYPPGT